MPETRSNYDAGPGPGEQWTGGHVAVLRARLGLSQAAFARRLGVRQQTVSEWETGRYQPRGASAMVLRILAEQSAAYDASPPGDAGDD